MYSLDFRKAFYFGSHQIVCNKLKSYNINLYVINWLINILSGRKQRVLVDGVTKKFVEIDGGVPQGTVLGPVFSCSPLWLVTLMLCTRTQTCSLRLRLISP